MFSDREWILLREAVKHRARTWRGQARSLQQGDLQEHCLLQAEALESIARSIDAHTEFAQLDDECAASEQGTLVSQARAVR